jgi:two-component system NtrC family sensor kinase
MIDLNSAEEEKRLKDLEDYGIIGTPIDPSFDHITKLAAAICGTPIAAVTFIETERQWIKSSLGLGGIKETLRSDSFCTFTIQDNKILEVQDATLDDRFKDNVLVKGNPNIRFYAGAPLVSPQGYRLGALCVIGQDPKSLSDHQLEALQILSQQVVELIELRKSNRELIKAKKTLEDQQELLINKARLQTIGELAGGVCHQINNPLAIIVGRSMILRSKLSEILPKDSDLFKELDIIDQTSQRVSGILKALRSYGRDMGQVYTETDMHELIEDTLTLIRPKFRENNIDLKYEKKSDFIIKINKSQIAQVLLDLLTNSIEAMEESAVRKVEINVEDSLEKVIITITDSGKGIKKEDQPKIFKAFFTTKSRHFGVGLSNALDYLNQHKGELSLQTSEGPTTFKLVLPKST